MVLCVRLLRVLRSRQERCGADPACNQNMEVCIGVEKKVGLDVTEMENATNAHLLVKLSRTSSQTVFVEPYTEREATAIPTNDRVSPHLTSMTSTDSVTASNTHNDILGVSSAL